MKKLAALILLIALGASLVLTGCGAKSDGVAMEPSVGENFNASGDAAEPDKDAAMQSPEGGSIGADVAGAVTDRKRIQYVTIEMETLEYDKTLRELKARMAEAGGYIESSRENGVSVTQSQSGGRRTANLTLRIPTDALESFTSEAGTLGNITSQNTTTKDVTEQYFDTEARLKSLELQRDRYMELLETATDMTYIIELTNALTDVTYQIESYTGTLNKFDSLIEYSTVTFNIYEVTELTEEEAEPESLGGRIAKAFTDSLDAFGAACSWCAVALAYALPFLAMPIIAVVVIAVIMHRRKKKNARRTSTGSGEGDDRPADRTE